MPSHLHEALLLLFRNRPSLAPELLRDALHVELPEYSEARLDSAELTDIQPAEYRADLVVLLLQDKPVLGIVIEVQLSRDEQKRFAWPVYAVNLRARLKCPVCLLVVAADDAVANWAAKPVDLGGDNRFIPLVLGPEGVPEIVDEAQAAADPELAVLSAMAHGRDRDTVRSARIALAAQLASAQLDAERSALYVDLILNSLSEAARRRLQTMDPIKYEYQSDFARHYFFKGRAEGEAAGRAAIVARLLTLRFGAIPEHERNRISGASAAELDAISERLLSATSLAQALGDL
jgi:hypothetical protein